MPTTYINEFLQAFQRGKSDPINARFDSKITARLFRKAYDRTPSKILDDIDSITRLADQVEYIADFNSSRVASNCHVMCDHLMTVFKAKGFDSLGLASITIGDVIVDGESLYDCSTESVTQELVNPNKASQKLGMHFWITCIDMTIIDLVLPYNLEKRGQIELARSMHAPFFFHPRNPTHPIVVHRPMVVDNDGPNKVDDLKLLMG